MAYSETAIAGADLAAHDLDKPILLADHQLRSVYLGASTGGKWNTTGNTGDADASASGYPPYRGYDGHARAGCVTKPNAAAATWYYLFDLSADPITFDTVLLVGPNLSEASGIYLEVADSAAFDTNESTILTLTDAAYGAGGVGTVGNRNCHTMLNTVGKTAYNLYSSVGYLRVKITSATTLQPEISELWLGTRSQLLHHPDLPLDNLHERSAHDQVHTRAGLTEGHIRHRGRTLRDVTISTATADELEPLTRWWDDSGRGARSFVWIENPKTIADAYLMAVDGDDVDFDPALDENLARRVRVPMRELAPLRSQD